MSKEQGQMEKGKAGSGPMSVAHAETGHDIQLTSIFKQAQILEKGENQ